MMTTPRKERIATETKTGRRYVVQQIVYGDMVRIYCWGELVRFGRSSDNGAWRRTHAVVRMFVEADVTIDFVALDVEFLRCLLRQAEEVLPKHQPPRLDFGFADSECVDIVQKALRS
jgi:hypothetical protein